MGNCMETCAVSQETNLVDKVREEIIIKEGVRDKEEGNGLKVKILLTKGELEWLMVKLKEKGGEKRRIEDLLIEMERERRRDSEVGWRPSLESIMEVPELQNFDNDDDNDDDERDMDQ